jgi:hypothetical protein
MIILGSNFSSPNKAEVDRVSKEPSGLSAQGGGSEPGENDIRHSSQGDEEEEEEEEEE